MSGTNDDSTKVYLQTDKDSATQKWRAKQPSKPENQSIYILHFLILNNLTNLMSAACIHHRSCKILRIQTNFK